VLYVRCILLGSPPLHVTCVCWSPWNEDHIFSATNDGRVIACAVETHSNDVLQPQHASSVLALAAVLLSPAPSTPNHHLKAVISCASGDIKCWVSSSQMGSSDSLGPKHKSSESWRQLQLRPSDDASSTACSTCSYLCTSNASSNVGSVILGSVDGWIHSVSIDSFGSLCLLCSHRSHTQAVTCLDVDANGRVASGGRDGSVAVAQGLFSGDDAGISCCKGSCDGAVVGIRFCRADASLLASCSVETSVSIWGLSSQASSCSLLPLKLFTACVGRLTCLEWISESADALIVGGEQQALIEVFWRLQPDAIVKIPSGASKMESVVSVTKAPKAKRQRRDDGNSHDTIESVPDVPYIGVENSGDTCAAAVSVTLAASVSGATMAALVAPENKQFAPVPSRADDHVKVGPVPAKSDALRRKSVEKSLLIRCSATSAIDRPVSEAVQSLMSLHGVVSGNSSFSKDHLSSQTFSEILCERNLSMAWAGECVLAAAKNPSTADAAVAVSSLAGAYACA
jgi:hypothetical protein